MSWYDKDCPSNPRDAYYEGRRSREYERNPYEHGRDAFADNDCREAHDEWKRGQRAAEFDREERAEQERAEERRIERQRQHHEELRRQEDEMMEQQCQEDQLDTPPPTGEKMKE